MARIHSKEFPWYAQPDNSRREHVLSAAKLMMNAAHTAPVTGGVDHMEAELIWEQEELDQVAETMDELSNLPVHKRIDEMFRIEAQMVRESDCILAIGSLLARNKPFDVNCGLCGGPDQCGFVYSRRRTAHGQIDHSDKSLCKTPIDGPMCQMHVHNLGYSVGSALWMARTLLVDARPFMTVGMAVNKLGCCRNSDFTAGILISGLSKNPCVDVPYNSQVLNIRKVVDSARQGFMVPRQFGLDYRLFPSRKTKKADTKE